MPRTCLIAITKSNFGGAQRYVFDIARFLQQRGVEVVVAMGGEGVLWTKLAEAGVRTVPLKRLGREVRFLDDLWAFAELWRIVRIEKPDVLHLNSSKIGLWGGVIGRMCGVRRIIFTAHAWEFNNPARGSIARSFFKVLSVIAVYLSHCTIAVSEAVRKDVAVYVPTRKLTVIHNGIASFPLLSRSEARLRLASSHFPSTELLVGTIAELHPVKGLDTALKAIARLKREGLSFRYVIVGEGEERTRLEKLCEELGIRESVIFAGFVNDAARYLHAFDAFLLPSYSEALGYVILEAGMAGVPVIASRVGGIPEIIEDTRNGFLIAPGDVTLLAARLGEMLSSRELRERLGNALKEKVLAEFSMEKMLKRTFALYER